MKSFRQYLEEAFLLENKAWHQFIDQYGDAILDKLGQLTHYRNNTNRGAQTPESKTNIISHSLGLHDLTTEEGRWVLKHFHGGGIQREEDVHSTVIPNLKRLRQARAEGKSDASLARIQGAGALHAHLAKVYPVSDESLQHLNSEEYTVHGENEHWTVVQPKTKAAACAVGKGTSWCTASTGEYNMFNRYNEQAPLYSIIPKNPVRKGERYQMHLPTDSGEFQFMDEHDNSIGTHQKLSPLSEPDRPLPEIKDPHARATIHGVRDLHDFMQTNNPEEQTKILTARLAKGSKHNSPEDTVNAAMMRNFSAYDPTTGVSDHTLGNLSNLRNALTRNGKQTAHQAEENLMGLSSSQQNEVMDDATMEHLQTHPDPEMRLLGARKKWKPEHVMRAAKDSDPRVAENALPHFDNKLLKQLGPEHVDAALEHPSHLVRINAINWGLRRGLLSHDQINKLVTDPDERVRSQLTRPENVPHLSPEHVHTILQHTEPTFTEKAKKEFANKPITGDSHMDEVRYYGNIIGELHPHQVDNPPWTPRGKDFRDVITPSHITRALENPDKYSKYTRQILLYHPSFDPSKHMDLARQNKDLYLGKTEYFPHGDPDENI